MESNRLKINTDKTQLIWITTCLPLSKVDINEIELQLDTVAFSTSVSDLGVIIDNQLPIRQRIVFKLATMVYKCQHGLCPSYLAEDCILLSATRQNLRLAGRLELLVPRTWTVTFGPPSFAVAGLGFGILCPLLLGNGLSRLTVSGGDWKLFVQIAATVL